MVASLYCIYRYGQKTKGDHRFYDEKGKGNIRGKAYFSVFLALALFLPILVLSDSDWTAAVLTICTAVMGVEVARGYLKSKQKTGKSLLLGNVIIILAYVTTHLPLTSSLLLQIVTISIVVDLVSNILGKTFARVDFLTGIRLQYPEWISPNKSFTAAILAIIVVSILNGIIPDGWELSTMACISAGVGAVFGDAIFSVFKRRLGIKDFLPTLGPIGGISDRADSWVFAILFATAFL